MSTFTKITKLFISCLLVSSLFASWSDFQGSNNSSWAANNISDTAIDDFRFNILSGRDVANGCDLPVDNILLNSDGSVVYNSSSDIGGFQFNVNGSTDEAVVVNSVTGGDATAAGFMMSTGGNMVLGFSLSGATFGPCGTMLNLDISGDWLQGEGGPGEVVSSGLSGVTVSDANGDPIDFTYYGGSSAGDDCQDLSQEICEESPNGCGWTGSYCTEYCDNCECSMYSDQEGCESHDNDGHSCYWEDNLCHDEGGGGPPECIFDCPNFQTLIDFLESGEGDLTDDDVCTIFAGWADNLGDCLQDCEGEDLTEMNEIVLVCTECLEIGNCEGFFGGDECNECHDDCYYNGDTTECHDECDENYCGDDGGGDMDWQGPGCMVDCPGVDDLGENPGLPEICGVYLNADEICLSDCSPEELEGEFEGDGIYAFIQMCEENMGGDDGGDDEADYVVEVGADGNSFSPADLQIEAGETVQWVNVSGFHNVDGSTDTYPNNPDSFYSGSASNDAWTYSYTFEVEGVYDYECTPHAPSMAGTITVGDGGGDNEGVVGDEPNTLWLADNGDGTYDVGYWTTDPIGGFQFNVDGTTINSASGGDASAAGFMVSAAGTTALGFSLTGATIAPGDPSVLLTLDLAGMPTGLSNITISDASGSDLGFTYDDGSPAPPTCDDMAACNYGDEGDCEYAMENYDCDGNCTADLDCLGECGGMAMEDECGICDGDGSSCLGIDLSFSNVNTADGTMDIYMMNELALGGFQIDLSGLNITSASGGSATDAGFMLSASGSVILGFSMTGATVPVGEGALVSITFDSPTPEICFADAVMSDSAGAAITTTLGDCYSGTPGCMDETACNYNMDATYDDGSCAYEFDCAGECGGMAMEDCSGMCDGDAMEDCAGECNGSAVIDDCGECDGGEFLGEGCNDFVCGFEAVLDASSAEECAIYASDMGWGFNGTFCDADPYLNNGDSGHCVPEGCYCGMWMDGDGIGCEYQVSGTDDCSGTCNGDAIEDACGECNGTETDPANCIEDGFSLSLANVDLMGGTLDVVMNNSGPVAGFQFNINGINITAATGGSAEANAFMVSGSGSVVVGFNMTGGQLPPGNTALVNVAFDSHDGDICLADAILSDSVGAALDVTLGDCYTGFGCMDMAACNYDSTAVFESDCYYEFDCNGDCGGMAVVDCLGECGGTAVEDCAGQCGGMAAVDCFNECGGGGVNGAGGQCCYDGDLDACGVCFGAAQVPEDCIPLVTLSFGEVTADGSDLSFSVDIHNTVPIAGWQFGIGEIPEGSLTIDGASGGSSEAAGHSVSFSADGTVVGFSLTGMSIPPSTGSLVNITASVDNAYAILALMDGVFSDPSGMPIPVEYGDTYTFGELPDVPSAPANLSAELVESVNVQLSWDGAADIDFFTIYRDGFEISQVMEASYYDAELLQNTEFTYSVSATNISGTSEMSADVSITTEYTPFDVDPPADLTATAGNAVVNLSWNNPASGGGGTEGVGEPCGEGLLTDCWLQCVDEATLYSWIGDGYCDDNTWGMYLDCPEFECDGGDCPALDCDGGDGGGGGTTGGGTTGGGTTGGGTAACDDCEFDWTPYGAECCDAAYEEFGVDCATLEGTYGWDCTGCNCPGDVACEDQGLITCSDGTCAASEADCPQMLTDCSGTEFDEGFLVWIGDGYCDDGTDQGWTPILDFNCEEYDFDGGDCDGVSSSSHFGSRILNLDGQRQSDTKAYYTAPPSNQNRDELTGINLWRSSEGSDFILLASLGADDESYSDTNVMNATEYSYTATAVYDNGLFESDYSNIASAMPMSTVELALSGGSVQSGDTLSVSFSVSNSDPISGFEFDLTDTPDYFTLLSVEGTERVPASWMLSSNASGHILGFAIDGSVIEAGDGTVLTVSYLAFASEPSNVQICTSGEIFSDSNATQFPVDGDCSSVAVTVEGIEVYADYNGGPVDQGGMANVSVSMSNPDPVTGFEIHLTDMPESIFAGMDDVIPSPELDALGGMLSVNENDGELIVLWFSLTGAQLDVDFGNLFTVNYHVSDDAADGYTWIEFGDATTFSNSMGQAMYWNGTGTGIELGLPDVFLSLVQTSNTTYEIHMDNLDVISGFQFGILDTPDYYTFVDVVGTDRLPTDWMVSGNDNMGVMSMLGFSLAGSLIEVGSGPILEVTVDVANMDFDTELCFDTYLLTTPDANQYLTVAECATFINPFEAPEPAIALTAEGGTGEVSLSWSMDDGRNRDVVDLEFGNVDFESGTVEVVMTNSEPVGGFQFSVSGASIAAGSGGSAAAAGFMVSASGTTALGFSLTGATIPAGSGVLTILAIDAGSSEICFDAATMSDAGGSGLSTTTGDCYPGGGGNDSAVTLEFGNADFESGTVEVVMTNSEPVGGFQFSVSGASITAGSGGSAAAAGFMVSASGTTALGFSLTGATIPAGSGVLTILAIDAGSSEICFDAATMSDAGGSGLSTTTGDCSGGGGTVDPIYGCTDMGACNYDQEATDNDGSCEYESCSGCMDMAADNYDMDATIPCDGCCEYPPATFNVYRDGILVASDIESFDYVDGGLENATQYCYMVELVDGGEVLGSSNEACATTDEQSLQHFTDLPIETGTTSLIIIQNVEGLEPGDEVGLFDSNGLLNYNDCDDEYGELLVGAGIYDGSQLNLVGVGSVDMCAFGGVQLAGYVDGNPIKYKVWKAAEDAEYNAEATYGAGSGVWGDIITSVSLLEPVFSVTQEIELNSLQVNLYSINVVADDMSTSTIFDGINLLITSDDGGNYYVPSFGVDQIGNLNPLEGYSAFLQGMDAANLSIEGTPLDPTSMIHLDGLQVNLMPYVPQDCMGTAEIFSGVEDRLLIVSDDDGNYFVPSFDVMTLTEMCPGDGYEVFLVGMDDLEFQYPASDGLARVETAESKFWSDYAVNSVSTEYDIVKTGISHPIILTELNGMVELGDELVAYADGEVVGATKIVNLDAPVVLSTWGSFTEYGADLPGYENGDAIELRLWSAEEGKELHIDADLDGTEYGSSPLTVGTATVNAQDAVPAEFGLSQNYPNPFNPSTAIEFSMASEGIVSLNVYDITGRMVSTLVEDNLSTGYHSVIWNGIDNNGMAVSAGIYIYALQTETSSITRKMVFMK